MDQETLQGRFVVTTTDEQRTQLTLVTAAPESQNWKGTTGPVTVDITGAPQGHFRKGTETYITFATQPTRVTSPAR